MEKTDLIIGSEYIGTCQDLALDGSGIVRIRGNVIFVRDLLPGEEAEIRILRKQKNIYFGETVRRDNDSPDRVMPDCPYFGICGGCSISHASYGMQVRYKEKHINDCLERIAGIDARVQDRIIDENRQYGYRNKISLVARDVKGTTRLCMSAVGGNRQIPVDRCLLIDENMNHLLGKLQEWIREEKITGYDPVRHRGFLRRVFIRKAGGRYLINLIINSGHEFTSPFLKYLFEELEYLSGITCSVNRKRTDDQIVERTYVMFGDPVLSEIYNGIVLDVSSESFSQVNREIAERMYSRAMEYAYLGKKDRVLDLYCGTGSITLQLARSSDRVTGVEVVESAVRDARRNAERNGISNVSFLCSTVEALSDRLGQEKVDAVVLDPPRKGCDSKTLDVIKAIGPDRIVYISCDPSTLARDISMLKEDYVVSGVTMCDMFCQSFHVESVVRLTRADL